MSDLLHNRQLTGELHERPAAPIPFPGPRPFAEEERERFFGRERETAELAALILAHRVLLMYGRSGTGKTSLLNAGVIPALRERGCEVHTFGRLSRVVDRGRLATPSDENRVPEGGLLEEWRSSWSAATAPGSVTLATALDVNTGGGSNDDTPPITVIVLDQFETMFNHPEWWEQRGDLFRGIQDSLDRDTQQRLRLVLVLRDDYLAQVEGFAHLFRDRLRGRYRLRGLRPKFARRAIEEPLGLLGMAITPTALDSIVSDLRDERTEDGVVYQAEFIEPMQLQIVCRALLERVNPSTSEIDIDLVREYGDVRQVLIQFYDEAVVAACRGRRSSQRRVRLFFEQELITPVRTRDLVFRDRHRTGHGKNVLPNETIDRLRQRAIIDVAQRGEQWYELTHDRFIEAVLDSNRRWFAARSRARTLQMVLVAIPALVLGAVLAYYSLVVWPGSDRRDNLGVVERMPMDGRPFIYPFQGETDELATLTVDGPRDAMIELYDADDKLVAESNPHGSWEPAELTVQLPRGGDFEARVSGGVPGEDLSLVASFPDLDVDGAPISDDVPAELAAGDEVDAYVLPAGRRGPLAITMARDPQSDDGTDDLDPLLSVITPSGVSLSNNDFVGLDSMVFLFAPEAADYRVFASSNLDTQGAYRLSTVPVEIEPLSSDDGGTIVRSGVLETGEIDVFEIEISGRDTILFPYLGAESLSDPRSLTMSILDADNVVLQSQQGQVDLEHFEEAIPPPGTSMSMLSLDGGTYYLIVQSSSGDRRQYTLRLLVESFAG